METWKAVVGFEGLYEVSDQGRVRSLARIAGHGTGRGGARPVYGRVLRRQHRADGYVILNLRKNNRSYPLLIHRIVLDAFVGLRPAGLQCAHNDGNKQNCCLSNLKWKTPKANSRDRIRHGTSGRGSKNARAKLTEADVRKIRQLAKGKSTRLSIAQKFGVGETAVDKIVWRQRWRHV